MGPEHIPLSCLGEVVLANVRLCVFFEVDPEHVPLSCVGQVDFYNCCVFEIWAPNTSRYRASGRLFLQASIIVFLRNGPRRRPGILYRVAFLRYGVPLSCLGEVVLANVKFCVFSKWAPNTARYPGSGRLSCLGQGLSFGNRYRSYIKHRLQKWRSVLFYHYPHLCGNDYWWVLAGTGRYWWVLVGTGAYWWVRVDTGEYRWVLTGNW